ncbi:MAG: RNA polymerase factor sigma-32 [Pseudobdellovibrionaceae bacterium]
MPGKKKPTASSTSSPASTVVINPSIVGLEDEASDIPVIDVQEVESKASVAKTDIHNITVEASKALITAESALSTRDPLVSYLQEIRKYKVLTKEEESVLAKKYYEDKDPEAAQALVKANLRFVVKIAAEYSKFSAKMIDLIQEGNIGLMHAVKEFNPYKGARLITYAVWWIRGYIQEYLMRQYSMVRIGTTHNQRKLFYQLQKEKNALDAMGKETNFAQLSEKLGIPEDEIRDMAQRMSGRDLSLDRPMDEDSETTLMDIQKNPVGESIDDQLDRQQQLQILKSKLEEIRPQLSEREKIILDERILNEEPLTLQEIGQKHGITREAVRQMEARLLLKIKAKMEA